jgi:hydroxyethylthiazole kinase-like uncharacterized protein yjeF
MTQVFSAKQSKAVDHKTCTTKNITSFELMHHAASKCTKVLVDNKLVLSQQKIVIVCGVGNNGGDGVMIASELFLKGYDVSLIIIDHPDSMSPQVKQALKDVEAIKIPIQKITSVNPQLIDCIQSADVLIDAILGIGLNRLCDEFYIQLIELINRSSALTISVDIPSGLNATNGFSQPIAIKADHTLVIGALKQGHVLFDGFDVCGSRHMVDIGLIPSWFKTPTFCADELLSLKTTPRKRNSHKYNFGHVLVVGGSKSMMGSVSLSSTSALKSGAGLVSLATLSANQPFQRSLPFEIMTPQYDDEASFKALLIKKKSVVYGMGLSKNKQPEYVLSTLLSSEVPLLIDADGLTHFKEHMASTHNNKVLVLTPHMEELRRLLDLELQEIKNNPIQHVEDLAKKINAIVLCKGPSTIISDGSKTEILEIGNPGLATAGTGDVLAGIIGTFIAQNEDGFEAIKQALILFDQAARLAKQTLGEHGMMASDIINYLPQAFLVNK